KVSIAASVASRSTLAAAPPVPLDVGGPDGATSADAGTPSASAAATIRTAAGTRVPLRRMTPSWARGRRESNQACVATRRAAVRAPLARPLREGRVERRRRRLADDTVVGKAVRALEGPDRGLGRGPEVAVRLHGLVAERDQRP